MASFMGAQNNPRNVHSCLQYEIGRLCLITALMRTYDVTIAERPPNKYPKQKENKMFLLIIVNLQWPVYFCILTWRIRFQRG